MVTEILYQVLLVVGIAVGILLIFNLWRLYKIMEDVQEIAKVTKNQVNELNIHLTNIEKFLTGLTETIKTFALSLDFIKTIKDRFTKDKKGEEDD